MPCVIRFTRSTRRIGRRIRRPGPRRQRRGRARPARRHPRDPGRGAGGALRAAAVGAGTADPGRGDGAQRAGGARTRRLGQRAPLRLPGAGQHRPLFAFLFLVALGVDYTIFLVTRAREETPAHGTRDGIVRAVSATGAVITSAGIVLAAVFCVLGVLPLIVLTQVGIIVGLGILLDTFVVRTVIIPALFTLIGRDLVARAARRGATVRHGEQHRSTPRSGTVRVRLRQRRGDDVLAEPADDRRHVGGAGRPLRHATHQVILVDPPGHGESQKLTAPFHFRRLRTRASSTSSTALGMRAHALRRQLVGRHDRRHVRRHLPRPHRPAPC